MKKFFLLIAAFLISANLLQAQLKVTVRCEPFFVDILNGKVNELNLVQALKKSRLSFCFTKTDAESTSSPCGGGVYFADKTSFLFHRPRLCSDRREVQRKIINALNGCRPQFIIQIIRQPSIERYRLGSLPNGLWYTCIEV